jgi:pimeloyl-ACP methyl ester carboxylesterase
MTRVTAPTLIVVGEVDLLTPPEHAHELNELIAGSRMATVARAGHHTPLEQPEVVTSLLAGFLDDVHRPG